MWSVQPIDVEKFERERMTQGLGIGVDHQVSAAELTISFVARCDCEILISRMHNTMNQER